MEVHTGSVPSFPEKSWIGKKQESATFKAIRLDSVKIGYMVLSVFTFCVNQELSNRYKNKAGFAAELKEKIQTRAKPGETIPGGKILAPTINMSRISALSNSKKYTGAAEQQGRWKLDAQELHIKDPTDPRETYGICFGICLDFAKRMHEQGVSDPLKLVEIANKFRYGGGTKAFSAQHTYSALRDSRSDKAAKQATADTMGLNFEGELSTSLPETFDARLNPKSYEALGFETRKPGTYQITVPTNTGFHAILFIKLENQSFFFDPNRGLIEPDPSVTEGFGYIVNFYNSSSSPQDPDNPRKIVMTEVSPKNPSVSSLFIP